MSPSIKSFVVISVLLNVLLAGMLIGQMFDRGPEPRERALIRLVAHSSLPEARKAEIQGRLEDFALRQEASRMEGDEARAETERLLRSDHFDASMYRQQTEAMFKARDAQRDAMVAMVAELGTELDAESREKLVKIFQPPPGCRPQSMHPKTK